MIWYKDLYVGESIVHKTKKVKWKIMHNAGQIGIYVITLASNTQNLLDIIPSYELMQKGYPKKDMAVVCVKIFLDKRVYENYEVTKTIKMGEVEKCKFYAYGDGVLRYSNDGISYMIGDETVWNQAFEMKQPVVDMCADYMAIADLEGTTVYIYDKNGQQGEIQTEYPILDIEVAGQGVVAAITKSDIANQIEFYDKDGTNIAKGQTVLSGDGCPVAR